MYTQDMLFIQTHEWVKPEQDNEVLVGITEHAQELLGDLVYVELPKVGREIAAKEIIGVIESVKAASDLYSPVSGTVIAINDNVVADPTLINQSPHTDGWLLRVKLNNHNELNEMLKVDEYKSLIG